MSDKFWIIKIDNSSKFYEIYSTLILSFNGDIDSNIYQFLSILLVKTQI